LRLCRDPALARQWGLSAAQAAHLVQRYRLPQPRNALAETLRRHAHAAMDVSDGLVGDLAKLCRASGVSAAIAADRVPLSAAARLALAADPTLLDAVLTGGDDYEILATVPPYQLDALVAAAARAGVALTEIGHVRTMAGDVVVRGADGSPLSFRRGSYSHF
jgi:thiamine-monophosphate kinase